MTTKIRSWVGEGRDVPLLDRVVERALPAVEPDLADGVQADDEDDAGRQQADRPPVPRRAERAPQGQDLGITPSPAAVTG